MAEVHIDYTKKLGEGAVGEVYEGTWFGEDPPVPCAVKILSGHQASGQSKQECKVAKKLKHPNIVHYYDVYHPEEKKTIFVMEKMDVTLTQFLENEVNHNTIDFQIHASVKISSALCYLHGKGIIHRDLSSNNILLNDNTLDVKVADFGVSKILDENHSTLTMLPGTGRYMPPEAHYDNPTYSTSLDIFSLGVVFIQMMTRLRPDPSERAITTDKSPGHTYHRTIKVVKEYIHRKAHIDKIPHDHPLRALALKCIQDDPEKRPTAEEVSVQLELIRTIRLFENQSKIAELKQELNSLKDKFAALKLENEERKKKITEWKQNTLGLISDSFDQLQ